MIDIPENVLRLSNALNKPIAVLELSTKSYNCLKRAGIDTVGELYKLYKDGNLIKVRNLGRKSTEEVLDLLGGYIEQHWEGEDG